jgi:hypothetical protein
MFLSYQSLRQAVSDHVICGGPLYLHDALLIRLSEPEVVDIYMSQLGG